MDQNKTAVPHFSTHSKTTAGLWKLKVHLTGAIHHGVGILGFFDVGQFKVTISKSIMVADLRTLQTKHNIIEVSDGENTSMVKLA